VYLTKLVTCAYVSPCGNGAFVQILTTCFLLTVGKCDKSQRNHQCLFTCQARLVFRSHDSFILGEAKQAACVCGQSFDTLSGKIHESLERYHNDQANICQAYSVTDYCQINQWWKRVTVTWPVLQCKIIGAFLKHTNSGNAALEQRKFPAIVTLGSCW
jgi:hypothetical protein